MSDNRELNRENLKKFLRERPLSTHALFRRDDTALVDIPLLRADFTIQNKPTWLLESVAGGETEFTADSATEAPEVELPPKPSEIEAGDAPGGVPSSDAAETASASPAPVSDSARTSKKKVVKKPTK